VFTCGGKVFELALPADITSAVLSTGLLTGMRPGAYSVSLNERDVGFILDNLAEALMVPGTTIAALLIRSTLDTEPTFMGALQSLSDTSTPAPSYITLGGVNSGEAAVITRDHGGAADVWTLDNGQWFLVETNYDHWQPDGDGRQTTAIAEMNKCGVASQACLFKVLSKANVLNSETTYTTIMSAFNSTFQTTIRMLS